MYTEKELVRVAKRENNNKRSYLVVNSMQAKHIPTYAKKTLVMFDELAAKVREQYKGERLLVIGFAETATAIGARLAVTMDCLLMQTTREAIEEVEYLYFSESHSHATEQKVLKTDLDKVINEIDRIVFAEDEVTTGNTIMKIIDIINDTYDRKMNYAVASLLNGMDAEALERYRLQNIDVHYLVKTDHSAYSDIAEQYECDGCYINEYTPATDIRIKEMAGYINGRRLVSGKDYQQACDYLWQQIEKEANVICGRSCLVIGTEECMYPAIFVAKQLEDMGHDVKCHSTTRSPIAVSKDAGYPLHSRYELRSVYAEDRRTFIYDIAAYDTVLIVTDAYENSNAGLNDLVAALEMNHNNNVTIIRWK